MNTELSTEQQTAIVDTKQQTERLEEVILNLGQVRAFDFINKLLTVSNLKTIQNIKESKSYKGLTYRDENNKLLTVSSFDEFCTYKLQISRSTIDKSLLNFNQFGEEFFEASQRIGLGTRELRKLRQLPSEEQALIINNEAVDLGDKQAIKELIEDFTFTHVTEKAELQKKLNEAEETVIAVRENSAEKQQELDEAKERDAKRKFSQNPWQDQTRDLAEGMLNARVLIEQGVNQLKDIFEHITNPDSPLEQKALDYCARSIFSEATNVNDLVYGLTSEVSALLSGNFKADLDAIDVLQELDKNED